MPKSGHSGSIGSEIWTPGQHSMSPVSTKQLPRNWADGGAALTNGLTWGLPQLICSAYRIEQIRNELGDEIRKLASYIDRLYALRNNDAVNRLALLSMILGIGALVTGYYGMNIPHLATILNDGRISVGSLIATSIMALLSLGLIAYIVYDELGGLSIEPCAASFPTPATG
jgi:CorA-like Mg2+ transporter protein